MRPLSQMTDEEYARWFAQTGGKLGGCRARHTKTEAERRAQRNRLALDWYYRKRASR